MGNQAAAAACVCLARRSPRALTVVCSRATVSHDIAAAAAFAGEIELSQLSHNTQVRDCDFQSVRFPQ